MRGLTLGIFGVSVALFAGCGSSNDSGGTHSGGSTSTGGVAGSGGSGGVSGGSGGVSGGTGGTTGGAGGTTGGAGGVGGGTGGLAGGGGAAGATGGAGGTGGGTGGAAGAGGTGGTGGTTGAIKTVFIIMMENHSWSTIKGSSSAPYINNTLVPAGGHAEQYYTPPGLHPSEPNYIWLEAGDALGIKDDNDPNLNHQATTSHLSTQLESANISWKAYVESIPGNNCPLTSSGLFVTRHTPQLFFDDVTNGNSASSAKCISHIRPYSELATDLGANTVARYNFITPNLCGDMHGETLGLTCNALTTDMIKSGDNWLKNNVPAIMASSAYTNGGVIFVLWDEGDEPLLQTASDGPIPLLVLSPLAKVNHQNTTKYTHSSMLKTLQEIFGVPLLGDAANATDLSDFFTTFP